MALTPEEQIEARAELTRIASERVTWLQAVEMLQRHAADAFRYRKDEMAQRLRAIAEEAEGKAKKASEAQDAVMRKLGMK